MRGQKLKRDVVVNLVFACVKILALMWVIRLAGFYFAPSALGLFLLARRLSSTGANLLQLGMSQTLLRYVSLNAAHPGVKLAYVLLAALGWLGVTLVAVPAFYALHGTLTAYCYPRASDGPALTSWTGLLLLATVLNFVVYSTFLAERRMILANVTELLNASGFLLLALLWSGPRATPLGTLQFQAVAVVGLSLAALVLYLAPKWRATWPAVGAWPPAARTFLSYGLPRGAITFLEMCLLFVGPWLLRGQVEQSGYLIIALTLVRVIESGIGPVVQVAAVVTAGLVGRGDEASIGEGVRLMFGTILHATVVVTAVTIPWVPQLVRLWLSDAHVVAGVLPFFFTLMWGILPYAVFQGLKGVVEVRWVQPLNLYTLLLGIGTQFLVLYTMQASLGPERAISLAMLASFWAMGVPTLLWMRAYLRPLGYFGMGRLVVGGLLVAILNAWLATHVDPGWGLLAVALSAAALAAILGLMIPSPFVRSLRAFVWPLRSVNA